jgi:hypothetical protein
LIRPMERATINSIHLESGIVAVYQSHSSEKEKNDGKQ